MKILSAATAQRVTVIASLVLVLLLLVIALVHVAPVTELAPPIAAQTNLSAESSLQQSRHQYPSQQTGGGRVYTGATIGASNVARLKPVVAPLW